MSSRACFAIPLAAGSFVFGLAASSTAQSSPSYSKVVEFGVPWDIEGTLIELPDGRLYGTTRLGGVHGKGTVFVVDPPGDVTTLHSFTGPPDGSYPRAALTHVDGALYGTTEGGGLMSGVCGTVFRLAVDGTLETLHRFECDGILGHWPRGRLLLASDGNLYGTTSDGGSHGGGTVFRHNPVNGQTDLLHSFDPTVSGVQPLAGLIQAGDGYLYGTTERGGLDDKGTVFAMGLDSILVGVYHLGAIGAQHPAAALVQAENSNDLYGTTLGGGTFGHGTVFALRAPDPPLGSLEMVWSFNGIDTPSLGQSLKRSTTPSMAPPVPEARRIWERCSALGASLIP